MPNLNNNASLRIYLAEIHEALEFVTELLVDTWGTKVEGDPERETAIVEARAILASEVTLS